MSTAPHTARARRAKATWRAYTEAAEHDPKLSFRAFLVDGVDTSCAACEDRLEGQCVACRNARRDEEEPND